jgi:hypothetical protein
MMKMKLFTVVLLVLGAGIVVSAAEVINVDLNGNNDDRPYIGNGAYDVGDDAVWTVYYGGWGIPIGSKRTEALVPSGIPVGRQFYSSVYAAQVWIGDKSPAQGNEHWFQWGSALMDDGFDVNLVAEPNISFFGQGAYRGVYDIYVYGSEAGSFKLTLLRDGVKSTQTQAVTGDAAPSQFELGKNYVVFDNVDINNAYSPDDFNDTYITYTNVINGLQLVKQKDPCNIEPNALGMFKIAAGNWDVAGDRNIRTDETNRLGPETYYDVCDLNMIGSGVGYLDVYEFMEYDINVPEASEGQYEISIVIKGGPTYTRIDPNAMKIYLDDKFIGEVSAAAPSPGTTGETTKVTTNLYEGPHTVRWYLYAGQTGANLYYLKFYKLGNAVVDDCGDIVLAGLTLTEDLNGDCVVDVKDLYIATEDWVQCNNPDPNLCF